MRWCNYKEGDVVDVREVQSPMTSFVAAASNAAPEGCQVGMESNG
jgi:hypothetical protein